MRLRQYLLQDALDQKFEIVGAGKQGNKIYDLYLRLDSEILPQSPQTVVIWAGLNDIYHKQLFGTGTDADRFESFYELLVQRLKSAKIEVVVCTPAVIGENTDYSNPFDTQLLQYADIVRNVSATHDLKLVDLRKVFLQYNLEHNTGNLQAGILTTDGINLSDTGNIVVAEAIWKVLFETRA